MPARPLSTWSGPRLAGFLFCLQRPPHEGDRRLIHRRLLFGVLLVMMPFTQGLTLLGLDRRLIHRSGSLYVR